MEAKDITLEMMQEIFPSVNGTHAGHRPPYGAGGADYYYHRPCKPNFTISGRDYNEFEMSDWQIEEYKKGWNDENDQKQY